MKMIKVVKNIFGLLPSKIRKITTREQRQLIAIICIPCLSITTFSLYLANISAYLIAFIFIILSILCTYFIVASKQQAEHQFRTLSNIVEAMIQGDYSLKGRLQSNKAFEELLALVNSLSDTLSRHTIEARESRLLLERIMEQMDAMVLAVDEKGCLVMANASAKKLFLTSIITNNQSNDFLGLKLAELSLGAAIVNAPAGIITFNDNALKGEHFLFKESFLSEGKVHQLYLITSADRLLMEKERKAWQSLLRVLSHELNNSLTPIIAISQAMQRKLKTNPNEGEFNVSSLSEGVNIINERAGSLSTFIASYSKLSHLPKPTKQMVSLKALLNNITNLFPDCTFTVTSNIASFEQFMIEVDGSQIEQVLINLFKNSIEAMELLSVKSIDIVCNSDKKWLSLSVIDKGAGITNNDNLFVPFYSTKVHGSGIGLTLCRQILFNHNGLITLQNNEVGAEAILTLPLS